MPLSQYTRDAYESRVSLPYRQAPVPVQRQPDLDVGSLAQVIWRRKKIVIAGSLIGLCLAVASVFVATRRYKATAEIQLMKEQSGLSAERLSGEGDQAASDALDFNMTLETYVNVLTSDMLALRVMKELDLDKTRDYQYRGRSANRAPANLVPQGEMNVSPEQRDWLVKRFHKNLAVEAVPGTRIIRVGFSSPTPALAAQVVNQLVSDFVAYNFQVQDTTMLGPSGVLSQELDGLKQELTAAENQAALLQRQSGGFGLSGDYNQLISRLEELNRTAMEAESNRVLKEAVYDAARSGDPELISSLAGSGSGQAGGLALIQQLRNQQDTLKAEYAEDSARYGENYPKLTQLSQRLASLSASINQEVTKLGDRAKTDFLIAQSQEATTKSALNAQKAAATKANDSAVQYLMAKDQADTDRQLYKQLSEKLHQAQLIAGLHASNINVFDPARVPASPASPNIPVFLGGGLAAGLLFGLVGAFAADGHDTRIRNIEEAETISGFPLLGVIPEFSGSPEQHKSKKPSVLELSGGLPQNVFTSPMVVSSVAEAYRTVRTSIMAKSGSRDFASVYMVTSAMAGEGKSTTSVNLASVFAQTGARTLVIDADLRSGSLGRKLGLRSSPGLTEALLTGSIQRAEIQAALGIDHLHLMQSGARPANPSELLTSRKFADLLARLKPSYEYIFIDTPPCIPVTDAVAVVKRTDGFIFVVRSDSTTRQALAQSVRRLEQVGTPCLGIVMNAVDPTSTDYLDYGSYGFPVTSTDLHEVA